MLIKLFLGDFWGEMSCEIVLVSNTSTCFICIVTRNSSAANFMETGSINFPFPINVKKIDFSFLCVHGTSPTSQCN